jgi:glycyl-tRNA synthetase beta chain
VLVRGLAKSQPDREDEHRGPPVAVAFDESGEPTAAARAFATKCGVDLAALGRTKTQKGEWLSCRVRREGRPAAELLPGLVQEALEALPVPRRMRWGDSPQEFVRPVHWVLMLHGASRVTGVVLGLEAGTVTYGHRFLAPAAIEVGKPDDYLALLEKPGFVVADFAARRRRVEGGVAQAAADAGGVALADDALYDEVTALTEWPVALTGRFDETFLELPREVIVATLTGHQRYFPLADGRGNLLARFVTVANLPSKDPDKVRDGNERVVRPRLADAAFFWTQDRRKPARSWTRPWPKVTKSSIIARLYSAVPPAASRPAMS